MIKSLEEHDFKLRNSAMSKVEDGWVRIIRTWTHEEQDAVFIIEDCQEQLTEEEPFYEEGQMVTYTVLTLNDTKTMKMALENECPQCESEDPNTCKH